MKNNSEPEPDKKPVIPPIEGREKDVTNEKSALKYSSLVFQMLVIIAIGVFGGIKLDQYLKTDPIFTVILSLISIICGIYIVIKDFIFPKK